jgi:hypothetical protein
MPRTTPEEVAKVVEVDEEIDIEALIDDANELVTEVCGDLGYTDNRLRIIEKWLTAHFYAIRDREAEVAQEWVGNAFGTQFRGKVDLGLNQTRFGQQVMLFDTAGAFARLNAQIENPGAGGRDIAWGGNPDTLTSELQNDLAEVEED